ncbi:MAG: ATP-binding cassette domain-containing protein [Nitrospirales bacterium]|nr:ATP-binding cassette domain-containing protein [Nitrospirales bacterium]
MVRVSHVGKTYQRGAVVIHALHDVTVHVSKGTFCAIMGPSGSGKSTLLNLIAGLDTFTEGDILLDGQSTREFTDADWTTIRREWIGMVFQAFHLVPGLTVQENVGLPLLLNGVASNIVHERIEQSLALVGMHGRGQHRPSELSGGEQQRVAIARACVHQPRLILADEPTGNLDSHNGADVVALLRRVSQTYGQTVIMATHSEMAAGVADCRYELSDGRLRPCLETLP